MYSPKIKEELVKRLYRLKQSKKVTLTHMVNEAIEKYLKYLGEKQRGE